MNELRSFVEGIKSSSVQPRGSAWQDLYLQLSTLQVGPVYVRYFQLPTRGRLEVLRNLHYLVIVKVEPRYCVVTLRPRWLLFERYCLAVIVDLHDTVCRRIAYPVSEDGSSLNIGKSTKL